MKTEKEKKIKESEIISFMEYALKRERKVGKSKVLNQVIELLELCPVCKGTHGKWIKKEDFKQKLGELAK